MPRDSDGTYFAIDEGMVRFKGRSNETTEAPGKPIPEGYKIWALATHRGYFYCWEFWQRKTVSSNNLIISWKGQKLSYTSSLVRQLAKQLPVRNEGPFALYLDNLFTGYFLLSFLRLKGIAACSTT